MADTREGKVFDIQRVTIGLHLYNSMLASMKLYRIGSRRDPRPCCFSIASLILALGCSRCFAQATPPAPVQPDDPVLTAQQPSLTSAQIVSTGDGDTLRVRTGGASQPITIRLACIDAPESDQPGGQAAAARLAQLLPRDAAVNLRAVDTDRYGRTVAEVY